jgi:hypothetical protein
MSTECDVALRRTNRPPGAGHCACSFGVSFIVARGQAWKPAPTGLGSNSGMPVQRQILRVGADRCVRPWLRNY